MTGLFVIIGVVVFLLLIFTDLGRTIGRTFIGFFVQDALKNPKAADAVLSQQIEEEQKKYGRASDLVNQLVGQKRENEDLLNNSKKELATVERNCDKLAEQLANARKSDDKRAIATATEGLDIYSKKRNLLISKVASAENALAQIEPMLKSARDAKKQLNDNINDMRHQKEIKVNELELNNTLGKLYTDLDKLRVDTATQKMVGKIDENIKKSKRNAVGAQDNYESQDHVKEARINAQLQSADNDAYIQSLLEKYSK